MVKNIKTRISLEWNITFLQKKYLCLRQHNLRSYHLVAEVTINREIWDKKKNANSKDIDGSVFYLNWNLLFQDNSVNQKIKLFYKRGALQIL